MEIKPCPFCGSKDLYVRDNSGYYVVCKNCDTYGPYGKDDEEAIQLWNRAPRVGDNDCDYPNLTGGCHIFPRRNKEEPKMGKCCKNCVHISEEIEGKVYCCEAININHSCKYWEALNPFGNSRPTCLDCKHRYYSWGGDNICNYCGREIGNPEGYVCDKWEPKEPEPAPLNEENPSGKPFINLARDELDVIQTLETKVNEYLMATEEAAELAQAMLKYCRACGHGSWTPINPKDATDAVIEEYADLLLAMEAGFPRHEGNKMFYNNLERVYKEKAKRWAERLKERGEE